MNKTDITIMNKGLIKLGQNMISSADNLTGIAQNMKAIYASTLETEMATFAWIFAETRAQLSEDKEKPAWGFSRQFTLPSDCLRERYIHGAMEPGGYAIEGNKILTNISGPLKIIYTRFVTDTSLYSPYFIEVSACKLAFELSAKVDNETVDKEALFRQYQFETLKAKRSEAIRRPNAYGPESPWVTTRLQNA